MVSYACGLRCDAMGDFGVEARGWANNAYEGVGVEEVIDAACGDLSLSQLQFNYDCA